MNMQVRHGLSDGSAIVDADVVAVRRVQGVQLLLGLVQQSEQVGVSNE